MLYCRNEKTRLAGRVFSGSLVLQALSNRGNSSTRELIPEVLISVPAHLEPFKKFSPKLPLKPVTPAFVRVYPRS